MNSTTAPVATHTGFENLQGSFVGSALMTMGVTLINAAGLATGQLAGLAVLLSKLTGFPFGPIFFLINLPFYVLAYRKFGRSFTLKTLACVTAVSFGSFVLPRLFVFSHIDPWAAAILSGTVLGTGLIVLFRHGASCGGLGIAALYLQDVTGWRAGHFQLAVDLMILVAGFFVFEPLPLLASILGAAFMNELIALNHRGDWYVAR